MARIVVQVHGPVDKGDRGQVSAVKEVFRGLMQALHPVVWRAGLPG